jgi:translation initiation factor IF-2
LLDALRGLRLDKDKRVAGSEAGGITQRLSAFSIDVKLKDNDSNGKFQRVVFVDTPGHAAFSSMRGQSALATDIAVLVVALDDGISHC